MNMKRQTFLLTGIFVSLILVFSVFAEEEQTGEGEKENSGLQLKVNQQALLESEDQQVRVDAASVMLYSDSKKAHQILIDVVSSPNNLDAKKAICRILKESRSSKKTLPNKKEFIRALVEMLKLDNKESARLAAETLLIFDYDDIKTHFKKILNDESLSSDIKANVIYALKLQPDMEAVFELIELLNSDNEQIVKAVEDALDSIGMSVAAQPGQRKKIIRDMKQKGKDEFFRDLRILQKTQMDELEEKADFWKNKYLDSLNKLYDYIPDDKKGEFLAELLQSPEPELQLWGLDKVYKGRIGTSSNLTSNLEPILVNLISASDSEVRLNTARVLALMVEINSAQQLLKQVKKEQVSQVKDELFTALGVACHYAFSTNSGIDLPEKVKQQTIELAAEFLMQDDPKRSHKGAEVLRKLIEQDNTPQEQVKGYLQMLSGRYKSALKEDNNLEVELLNIMAGLCAEQNPHNKQSQSLFEDDFVNALESDNEQIRLAGMKGLMNIGRTKALQIFRNKLINDKSQQVQKELIELTKKVGNPADIEWLYKKIGQNSIGADAWSAMLDILKNSDLQANKQWFIKISEDNNSALSDKKKIDFFVIAEQKAENAKDKTLLKDVREKLLGLHQKASNADKSAQLLGKLLSSAESQEQKDRYFIELLKVYLQAGRFEKVKDLVNNRLLERDISPDDEIAKVLVNFINHNQAKPLTEQLRKIKVENRNSWSKIISEFSGKKEKDEKEKESKDGKKPESDDAKSTHKDSANKETKPE
jgi:pentatricopeptide repeat protein